MNLWSLQFSFFADDEFRLEIDGPLSQLEDRIEKIYWNDWNTNLYVIRFDIELKQKSDKEECMKIVEHIDISQKPNKVYHSAKYCPSSQSLEFQDIIYSTTKAISVKIPNVSKKIVVNAAGRPFVKVDGKAHVNSDWDLRKVGKVTKSKIIVYSVKDVIDVSNMRIVKGTYYYGHA